MGHEGSLFTSLSNALPRQTPCPDEFLDFNLLNALLSGGLKFIAGKPTGQRGLPRGLRPEHETKSCDDCVAGKIHVRAVFVARLVITVLGEILGLLLAPLRGMAGVFDPFVDRKRRHAHARQAEMI